MQEPRWTLDELAERVDAALAVDYAGPPSGRVRAVPDRRAIRWYTTIGLIDRPVAHRGRTALYGPRHLLQLVAVKRLQAKGLPLVAIQQELAGATDSQLARVAHLPPDPEAAQAALASSDGLPSSPGTSDRPGLAAAGGAAAALQLPAGPPWEVAGRARDVAGRARRASFWREPPAALSAASAADATTPGPAAPGRLPDQPAPAETLRGVRLGEGATLLLEPGREPDAADLQAIADAARPLLAVLRDRGLGPRPAGGPEPGRERP
jgi:MerR HTH family regulatory protein